MLARGGAGEPAAPAASIDRPAVEDMMGPGESGRPWASRSRPSEAIRGQLGETSPAARAGLQMIADRDG